MAWVEGIGNRSGYLDRKKRKKCHSLTHFSIIHYEPSIDALSWEKREARYKKKFQAGRRYILKDLFSWLPKDTKIEQVAVFINHPKGRDMIAGGRIIRGRIHG